MKYKINEDRSIYDGFFNVREQKVQFDKFDGSESREVNRIILYKNEAVAALVLLEDTEEVVLIRQFRLATAEKRGGWIIECVAGGIDEGESPESAITREIAEEVEFETSRLRKIASFYASPGITDEFIHLYLAYSNADMVAKEIDTTDSEEDIEVIRIKLDQLNDWLMENAILDAKTIIALQFLSNEVKSGNLFG